MASDTAIVLYTSQQQCAIWNTKQANANAVTIMKSRQAVQERNLDPILAYSGKKAFEIVGPNSTNTKLELSKKLFGP
jgi:hypothetical protein